MLQMKGLRPRCFLLCLVSSSERENLQPQSVQGHVKGFSPVWVLVWACTGDTQLVVTSELQISRSPVNGMLKCDPR